MSNPPSVIPNATSLLLVSESEFRAIAWTCVAVSFCFIAFRVYVRFRVFNRLFDDDALVILSWFIVLTTAILWHVQQSLSLLYVSYGVAFGGVTPPPYFLSHFTSWLRITFAQTFLNFCALWCIKLSFLAFFRKLGHHVRGQKVLWFVVLGVTIAGWAVSVGVIYYPCTFMTLEKAPDCAKPAAGQAIRRNYRIQIAADFITDFLILLIPLNILRKVGIRMRTKVLLSAMFSLTLVTMIFAIIRVEIAIRGPREDDTWYYIAATVEITLAIIICCVVSYRSLWTKDPAPSSKYKTGSVPLVDSNGAKSGRKHVTAGGEQQGTKGSMSSLQRNEEAIPLDMIRVENEYTVNSFTPPLKKNADHVV